MPVRLLCTFSCPDFRFTHFSRHIFLDTQTSTKISSTTHLTSSKIFQLNWHLQKSIYRLVLYINKFEKTKVADKLFLRPNKCNISAQVEAFVMFSSNYEHFLLMAHFNVGLDDSIIKDFCNLYNLKSLINRPTCCKTQLIRPAMTYS